VATGVGALVLRNFFRIHYSISYKLITNVVIIDGTRKHSMQRRRTAKTKKQHSDRITADSQ
jgi:hypothetical protein